MGLKTRSLAFSGALLVLAALSSACSGAPSPSPSAPAGTASASTSPGSTTATRPLKVLVTNDDGYAAAGIDGVVEALRKEPNVEVAVVAPLENQSGSGGKTTDGPLTATDVKTASGYPAKAVKGFPADSVRWALDGGIGFRPDLVVSGNNEGTNLGPLVDISGTIGAARAGAKRGIPAVAVSQGLGSPPDYPAGTKVLIDWFRANRSTLPPPTSLVSFNVPTCKTGSIRGLLQVPAATGANGRDLFTSDCTSTSNDNTDDVDAFDHGYATQSNVSLGS